ncbi:MSHA biogenesis protein, MshQ [mine drainage metagenome]|uniref:MSHA biogenesis protein, MshQ n=1 Tax=mine drainage metagenome TaxID=410659 RepID=T1ADG5_9ZZZZ
MIAGSRLLATALVLFAASTLTPAHAVVSYSASPTSFSWLATSGQTLIVAGSSGATWSGGAACTAGTYDGATPDDDITWQTPLGFTFNYGGTSYTTVQIDANGRLQFNNGACGYGGPFIQIPTTPGNTIQTPITTIIPYSVDFDPGDPSLSSGKPESTDCVPPGCGVYYGSGTTSAGIPYFVVTWQNVPQYSYQTPTFTVQAILYANGTFEFQYENNTSDPPLDSNGNLPAIGWVIDTTSNYWNDPYITNINNTNNIQALNNTAILFSPNLLDQFAISAPAYGSTCSTRSVPVTIVAEDAAGNVIPTYTGLVTISVSSNSGNATLTPNEAQGTLTFIGFNSSTGYPEWTYQFVPADAGEIVLNLSDPSAETVTVTVMDSGTGIQDTSGPITFRGGSLVVANAPGEIPVPVAGRPQDMTVTYYNRCTINTRIHGTKPMTTWLTLDPNQPSGAALPGVTGNTAPPQTVSPLPTSTSPPPRPDISLVFTQGVADFTLDTSDIGKYLLNWCYGKHAKICGSAPVTVIPYDLLISVSGNPGAQSPTDPVFTKAGKPFAATVTAYAWSPADTCAAPGCSPPTGSGISVDTANSLILRNFSWPTTITAVTPFLPSAGTLGTLTGGSLTVSGGTGTVNTLAYSEVGSVTLEATGANYLDTPGVNATGDSYYTGSLPTSSYVGRFTPDHFDVTVNQPTFASSCGSRFSYLGQPLEYSTAPVVTLTAVDAQGATTLNYSNDGSGNDWWKLPDLTPTYTDPNAPAALGVTVDAGLAAFSPPTSTNTAPGSVTTTFSGPLSYTLPDTGATPAPIASPFSSDITVSFPVEDSDGIVAAPKNPFTFTIGFAAGDASTIRQGRLIIPNAYGSEELDLNDPMVTQYYLGPSTGWVNATDDQCTTGVSLALASDGGPIVPADTCVWEAGNQSGLSCGSGKTGEDFSEPPVNGNFNLWFKAPDVTGPLILQAPTLPSWLEYDWNGTGQDNQAPEGTLNFGLYHANPAQIYWYEIY